jgi:hypothetical protein
VALRARDRQGDLALLYKPAQQVIVGVLAAGSSASQTQGLYSRSRVCRFEIVTRFPWPVPVRDLPDVP